MARTVKPLEISSYISKQIREAKQPVSFAFFCERRFIKVTAPFGVPPLGGIAAATKLQVPVKTGTTNAVCKKSPPRRATNFFYRPPANFHCVTSYR